VSEEQPRDAGFTIVEMVVAIGLFVMLISVVGATAVLALRTTDGIGARLDNANQSQQGIAAVSKVLRTAVLPAQLDDQTCTGCTNTAIIQATTTRVTFYANLDNTGQGPSLVTLQVVQDPAHPGAAMLQELSQPPIALADDHYTFCTAGQPGCTVATRVLARGLSWPATAVFAYYDFGGAAIAGPSLGSADLPRVSSLDVVITSQVRPSPAAFPASTLVQRVRLPNADINVLVQPS
jgi:type II secretory pathway pseudopilin PulG